jgi:DNA polymerase
MTKRRDKTGAPPVEASAFNSLNQVYESLEGCKRCKLCKGRTNIVLGEGSTKPEILFVGEAPGAKEDETGRPFVGRSGQLLTKMIEAMGVKREEVFIANVVKCRPPENRPPKPEEVEQCRPFLEAQIKMLKPKVVVALGKTAAFNLLQTKESIGDLRGKIHSYQGTKLIATFHPAYLLRNPPAKKDCWEDLQLAMKELGWKVPVKS